MGKEKRLFLLAIMAVMISTTGYSAKIHDTFNRVKDKPEEIQKTKKESFSVIEKDDIGYRIQTGQKNTDKTNVESYANITVENGTGIKLELGEKVVGKNNVFNKGTITVNNGVGVDLVTNAKDKENPTNTFVNDGTIIVAKGTGIQLNNEKDDVTNNNEIIVNKDTAGTGVSMSAGKFTNGKNGTIIVEKNGTGINQTGGTSKNEGNIVVSGGIGLNISKGNFTNTGTITVSTGNGIKSSGGNLINNGIIEINKGTGVGVNNSKFINDKEIKVNGGTGVYLTTKGEFTNNSTVTVNSGIGVNQVSGTLHNLGTINVQNQGIGINISKDGILGKTAGTINVSDEGSTGIKINENTKNQISYNGNINVTNGTGVEVLSSKGFENKKVVTVNNGVGVKVVGKGTAINNGTIEVKQGTGAEVLGGTFTNNKIIKADGKDAVGVTVNGGNFINKKDINVVNNALGVKVLKGEATNKNKIYISWGTGVEVENGKFTNESKIEVAGGQKGNAGVKLNNGIFVNSGEIIGKGFNGAAVAIESLGGNNTVFLKKGSNVSGKIVGADGVDVLALEGNSNEKGKQVYNGLKVENYEKIAAVNGDVEIGKNSSIELEYNKDKDNYKNQTDTILGSDKTSSGNLTMSNSNLIIDFKDSLTNPNGTENPIIDVGTDGKLILKEGMKFDFTSSDGRDVFNLNEALGLKDDQIKVDGNFDDVFKDTAVWEYDNSTGDIILKKHKYEDVISKPQLKEFAGIFENPDNFNEKYKDKLEDYVTKLNLLETKEEFTNAMTQMSGAVHGYVVDFAALNARTMVNTMRNRALSRDYMRKRPLNSWTQDVMYIDNNHRLGGLMDVNYNEQGVLGVSEKQILKNGRLGIVYGGSSGNAKFEGGENGTAKLDGAYFGGYYNHEFSKNLSLNSNANFVYTHNRVTRNVKFADVNETFKSAYPTYTVGIGSSLIYTVKDDLRNKAHFYAGVDVERLMIGNINENKNLSPNDEKTGLAIKTTSYNPRTYYSIVPNAGFMVQNTGYVFDKKYRIGADLNWETEIGNIKDGKRLKITGIDKEYKVETTKRENVFSYSLFGALDLTESLAVNAKYTSMFSDEYNADMIGAGFEYKMDTMADNFFGSFAHKLENRRSFSDRWGMTLGLTMEMDDVDDYTTYYQGVSSGDVATSMEYKPKLTLSINDKKSNWSYYFETYHKTNNMFGSIKSDEKESHASRIHGEARWNDRYSKGNYGMSFGYRNEFSEKSEYYKSYGARETAKTGTHELRLTPNFTYNIGNDFVISAKSAIVFMYKYEGDRAGQMDMNTESQVGLTYTGFMPRWSMTMNFYREDTWYDHSNSKAVWDKKGNGITGWDDVKVAKRDQVNQLRPSVTYYFGNGSSFVFDARIPLSNGSWANNMDGSKASESYESRYGFNYYFPVTPGFTANIGGTFLNIKTKNKDHSKGNYGNISRSYAFRPNIGFSYSF